MIYDHLHASNEHPSAQEIFGTLKKEIPRLSLGTVYRNIAILLEEGRIWCGEFAGHLRYDAVTSPHYHFLCEKCGAVSDFAMPARADLEESARRLCRHRISGHTVRFFGTCSGCLEAGANDKN